MDISSYRDIKYVMAISSFNMIAFLGLPNWQFKIYFPWRSSSMIFSWKMDLFTTNVVLFTFQN